MQRWEYCMVVRVAGHSSTRGPYGELVLLNGMAEGMLRMEMILLVQSGS